MRQEIENYLTSREVRVSEKTENHLKFCDNCKSVWDYWWQSGYSTFKKYPEMPSYKLERSECRECAGKELSAGRKYTPRVKNA